MASTPDEVLTVWFEVLGPTAWFEPDAAVDAKVRAELATLHEAAARGELEAWTGSAEPTLALILLLDQAPRNLHRGTGAAFSCDPQALAVAERAVNALYDLATPHARRAFFYLPFMHSETLAAQDRSVRLHRDRLPAAEKPMRYAIHHRDIVARFGRFPHRNALLGRVSTPEEEAWLAEGGFNPA